MNAILTQPSDYDDGLSWFALKVPGQKEFAAEATLKRRGFRTFVPIERKWRRACRYDKRKVMKAYPMLVGYCFIGASNGIPWYDLASIRIILGVVSFGGQPARLPSDAIAHLMRISGTPVPYAQNPHKAFRPGDRVAIVEGPFSGQTTTVNSISAQKARVMLEMFASARMIDVPLAALEAA